VADQLKSAHTSKDWVNVTTVTRAPSYTQCTECALRALAQTCHSCVNVASDISSNCRYYFPTTI